MALINTWKFTNTIIDWDLMKKGMGNEFKVVSVRDYTDKKGVLNSGYTLTLLVLEDCIDYGFDKEGNIRENNQYQTFQVTVLNRDVKPKKGDIIELLNFDSNNSFVIGFDLLLRFSNIRIKEGIKK